MLVARPSKKLLADFRSRLAKLTVPYATRPDSEFLSAIYLDGYLDGDFDGDLDGDDDVRFHPDERFHSTAIRFHPDERFHFLSADYGQCGAGQEQTARARLSLDEGRRRAEEAVLHAKERLGPKPPAEAPAPAPAKAAKSKSKIALL